MMKFIVEPSNFVLEQDSGVVCNLKDPCQGPEKRALSQCAVVDGRGLAEWRVEMQQLMEQKRAVERELGELKSQLEKAGFASLSQMRWETQKPQMHPSVGFI